MKNQFEHQRDEHSVFNEQLKISFSKLIDILVSFSIIIKKNSKLGKYFLD
jgi:hypothetical protein